jgi:hypothetical protein
MLLLLLLLTAGVRAPDAMRYVVLQISYTNAGSVKILLLYTHSVKTLQVLTSFMIVMMCVSAPLMLCLVPLQQSSTSLLGEATGSRACF